MKIDIFDLTEAKCGVWQIITIMFVTHIERFIDLNFNKAVIDKISNFHEIAPNSAYSQKSDF